MDYRLVFWRRVKSRRLAWTGVYNQGGASILKRTLKKRKIRHSAAYTKSCAHQREASLSQQCSRLRRAGYPVIPLSRGARYIGQTGRCLNDQLR
ncbi:uncharacterized protein LOC120840362, partial [Ixodes scapularis]|uniref:uncharacterized protein LOC120840362 n=1 Tax=Ixodes scapularis TaxID=6945 RepID=UPI001C384E0A